MSSGLGGEVVLGHGDLEEKTGGRFSLKPRQGVPASAVAKLCHAGHEFLFEPYAVKLSFRLNLFVVTLKTVESNIATAGERRGLRKAAQVSGAHGFAQAKRIGYL